MDESTRARRELGEGAAQAAPTAPHATPHAKGQTPSGPERFWSKWPLRVAFGAGLVASGLAHCSVLPLEIPRGFEVQDVDGEAAIPVDLIEPEDPGTPPPAPVEPSKSEVDEGKDPSARGSARDGGARPHDAAATAASRPASRAVVDAVPPKDTLDGAVAEAPPLVEAGGPAIVSSSGPRDPQGIVGAAGAVQADTINVVLLVNAEVIRQNPIGARMGFLLRGIPQWNDFMRGTDVDPVRDVDWLLISGPSLVNTAKDVVLVHYSASDALVDHDIDIVSRKYANGGPFDAGVPGVKASLAHGDRAERVIMRPQSRVLVVLPPSIAEKYAKLLHSSRIPPHIRPGEAAYLRLVNPHHAMPEIPDAITEMRLRAVPRPDDGADLFIDGDTTDAEAASRAARSVKEVVRSHNDTLVSFLTRGLLDGVQVTNEGSVVKVHLTASKEQLATLLNLVAGFLGVTPAARSDSEGRAE